MLSKVEKCIDEIFNKHVNLQYTFGNRYFWSERYYVNTAGLNEATIKDTCQNRKKHDITTMDKLRIKEYEDLFKG